MKLHYLRELLHALPVAPRRVMEPSARVQYFLPDWDDFVDAEFDFERDRFSSTVRSARKNLHVTQLFGEQPPCDGVLVTLGQRLSTKGMLSAPHPTGTEALAPVSARHRFGLSASQWAFGDCGAYTYINQEVPSISTAQALELYELHDFDYGASVDHIAAAPGLTELQRRNRVSVTIQNAAEMISLARRRGVQMVP